MKHRLACNGCFYFCTLTNLQLLMHALFDIFEKIESNLSNVETFEKEEIGKKLKKVC